MDVSMKSNEKLAMGTIPTRAPNFFPPCFFSFQDVCGIKMKVKLKTLTEIVV